MGRAINNYTMQNVNLYMVLLGCTPKGRHIEQHDVFFGIANNIKELVPEMIAFWPEAEGDIHIDAWRIIKHIDGYNISVSGKPVELLPGNSTIDNKLFFLNLGGYKQNEFEEYHYKMLAVAGNKGLAVQQAKQTAFYKHTGFKGAESHIDDKYGVDIDNVHAVEDILPAAVKEKYTVVITEGNGHKNDELHLGYFMLDKL